MLGMEMMLKSIGFDPEQFKQWMGELNQFASSVQQNIAAIRRDQELIMQKLGIEPEEQNHARSNGTDESARIGNDTQGG